MKPSASTFPKSIACCCGIGTPRYVSHKTLSSSIVAQFVNFCLSTTIASYNANDLSTNVLLDAITDSATFATVVDFAAAILVKIGVSPDVLFASAS